MKPIIALLGFFSQKINFFICKNRLFSAELIYFNQKAGFQEGQHRVSFLKMFFRLEVEKVLGMILKNIIFVFYVYLGIMR
jgi:hypothetical protein